MTSETNPLHLVLSSLADGRSPGLPAGEGLSLAEAAATAIDRAGSGSPAAFEVEGKDRCAALIEFAPVSDQMRRGYADPIALTERGAVGVALGYLRERHGQLVVERARIRSGFDYYMGVQTLADGPPFRKTARAEITGIADESDRDRLEERRRIKHLQVARPGASRLPAWIVYVRFSRKSIFLDAIPAMEAA